MDPNAKSSQFSESDEDMTAAPTSPWTDALHTAWTQGGEGESTHDQQDSQAENPPDPLIDTYV